MKIVRLSKNSNLNRIDKVFKWFRFSGRGPKGNKGDPGAGLPSGGDTGDSVGKASATDFDYEIIKNNLSATSDPTTANDDSEGYAKKSKWYNTATSKRFECLDSSTGAANWVDLSASGGGGGGEWTEVARTVVATGVTSVDFLNVFTDTYDTYRLRVVGGHVSVAGRVFRINLGYGVGPTWAATGWYASLRKTRSLSTAYSAAIQQNADHMDLSTSLGGNAYDQLFTEMQLYNLRSASLTPYVAMEAGVHLNSGTPQMYNIDYAGWLDDTTNKMEHLTIFLNASDIDGGTFVVEGKNS